MTELPLITSRQNEQLKTLGRYRHKKHRDQDGQVLVMGDKVLKAAFASSWPVESIYFSEKSFQEDGPLAVLARTRQVPVTLVREALLRQVLELDAEPTVVALLKTSPPDFPRTGQHFLVLAGVQDPNNCGALIRCAEVSGCAGVICLDGCADPYGPKALRASAGAAFYIPIMSGLDVEGLEELLSQFETTPVLATMDGQDFRQFKWPEKTALIMGAEGQGQPALLKRRVPQQVAIPQAGESESMNVAAAGTLLLYAMQGMLGEI